LQKRLLIQFEDRLITYYQRFLSISELQKYGRLYHVNNKLIHGDTCRAAGQQLPQLQRWDSSGASLVGQQSVVNAVPVY